MVGGREERQGEMTPQERRFMQLGLALKVHTD